MNEGRNLKEDILWRVIIFMFGLILGVGSASFTAGRNVATKDDVAIALLPIQKQLDDLAKANGENNTAIVQLDVDVARISATLGVTANPVHTH